MGNQTSVQNSSNISLPNNNVSNNNISNNDISNDGGEQIMHTAGKYLTYVGGEREDYESFKLEKYGKFGDKSDATQNFHINFDNSKKGHLGLIVLNDERCIVQINNDYLFNPKPTYLVYWKCKNINEYEGTKGDTHIIRKKYKKSQIYFYT